MSNNFVYIIENDIIRQNSTIELILKSYEPDKHEINQKLVVDCIGFCDLCALK
jgi:hypothetical protein